MKDVERCYDYDASYPYLKDAVKKSHSLFYITREILMDYAFVYAGLNLKPGDTLLDVGSCIGSLGRNLSLGGIHGYGVDINVAALREGKRIFSERAGNVSIAASAVAIPFPDGSFDAVVSQDFFEHCPSAEYAQHAFEEMERVLSPDKKRMFHKITVTEDAKHIDADPSHCLKWSIKHWSFLFERNGWSVVGDPTIHIPFINKSYFGYFFIQKVE